ncbi:MAG: lipopolysaccharide assembly protein LapA domain-containing protein, partial [Opitutaceae bacterium]
MKIKLLLALFLMLIIAVFSVQNAEVITLRFLHWSFALSEAPVILLAAFAGALAGLVVGALAGRSPPQNQRSRRQETENGELSKEH